MYSLPLLLLFILLSTGVVAVPTRPPTRRPTTRRPTTRRPTTRRPTTRRPTTRRPTTRRPTTFKFNQCTTTDDCCNGLDTICDLNVNEVLFAGTHNSYASQDEGFIFLYANQITKVEDQMDAGYRAINLDICSCSNALVLCHNSCFMTRSTNEVFTGMVSFLDNNPTEILLVTLELNSDLDQAVDLNDVYSEMQAVTGFVDYMYIHSSSSTSWPTLRELKEAGTVRDYEC